MVHPSLRLLSLAGLVSLSSCTGDDGDGGTAAGAAGSGGHAGGSGGHTIATGGGGAGAQSAGGAGAGGGSGGSSGGEPLIATCTNLVSDTVEHAPPVLELPGYLESVVDPVFGTTVTRVTGNAGEVIPNVDGAAGAWRDVGGPGYAKRPSWNADQSLLQMTNTSAPGVLLLDGSSYEVVAFPGGIPGASGGEKRWHPTDPALMVYVAGDGRAGYWNPLTGDVDERFVPASSLSDCTIGPWEGNVSNDGNWVVVACDINGVDPMFFAVDLRDGTRYVTIHASELGFSNLDWASISPLGGFIVASQNWEQQRTLTFTQESYQVVASWEYMGHYDLGLLPNGDEVAANASGYYVRIADGAETQVVDTGAEDYHTSTRNLLAPGWSYNSFYNGADRFLNEIWAMELQAAGRIRRLAHHHCTGSGYDRAPLGSASPDGNRVFFRSDWDDGSGPVYGFVVDIRGLCP